MSSVTMIRPAKTPGPKNSLFPTPAYLGRLLVFYAVIGLFGFILALVVVTAVYQPLAICSLVAGMISGLIARSRFVRNAWRKLRHFELSSFLSDHCSSRSF